MTPTPYYVSPDGAITIYCGDYRDVVPHLGTFDAIVTDPPYGLTFRGEDWDACVPDWLPLARSSAPIVVFTTAPTTMWDYPRPDWVACWERPGAQSRAASGGFNHWTPVLVYGPVKFPVDTIWLPAATNAYVTGYAHPSPKPIALMRWLVEHASTTGDLILDPFMGSGTTLRAAKDLGRRAIGIEINEEYCAIAVERLRQEVLL